MEQKRQTAKKLAALFKSLARLGVAVSSPADREAWKGLMIQVKPKNPDEAAGIVAHCIEIFRDSTGKELRWPSEARTWIERAAREYRKHNEEAA